MGDLNSDLRGVNTIDQRMISSLPRLMMIFEARHLLVTIFVGHLLVMTSEEFLEMILEGHFRLAMNIEAHRVIFVVLRLLVTIFEVLLIQERSTEVLLLLEMTLGVLLLVNVKIFAARHFVVSIEVLLVMI